MILITGSESFVGKELIKQCKENKISVMGIDSMNIKNAEYIYHQIDIRDPKISEVIPKNIDAIIHLAALSRDADCKDKAYECFDVNVIGTLNLIKAANKKNVKQFIFASSEWVYNDFTENEEKDENEIIDASKHTSEYALSKIVSEINLKQQFMNKFCSVTILRFGIIYGPRKNNWSAVESIAHNVKESQEVTIGSRKTGRRFIHINDIIQGIILAIGIKGFNIINLTGNEIVSLDEIIHTSEKVFNKKVIIKEKDPENISLRNPSNCKAKKILNWEPKINLKDGIESIKKFI